MTNKLKSMSDRVLAIVLSILMIVATVPAGMISVMAETASLYGTVTTFSGGTVSGNGTETVEVIIEETTVKWVEANDEKGRAAGWWVGINVIAPEGYSADATYKVKTNPSAEYGDAKSFVDNMDGEDSAQFWFAVSVESLKKFADESRCPTMTYAFDWNGDGVYGQTVVFSLKPSEKIVLMKGEEQMYPKPVSYGTVTTYTGGEVTGNGTGLVEVVIEKTTLNWVEGNDLRSEGWWVGINAIAPEGYSADATYKVKSNPAAEFGPVKSFEGNKDTVNSIQLWFGVSPDALKKFASESRDLIMTYAFDWNADGLYEQTIVFSLKPSDDIVLMKGDKQEYPVLTSNVTVSGNEGGTIAINGDATGKSFVIENGSTVNVKVEAAEGYRIATVTVNGNETVVDGKEFAADIEDVNGDVAVSVVFVKLHTVTVIVGANGSVTTTPESSGGSVTVTEGTEVTIVAKPDEGYHVSEVIIGGEKQEISGENDSAYTAKLNADKEYTVEVTFAPNVYNVEKEETDNGSFEIKDPVVEHGGSTTVVVTPGAGYTVDTFAVEGATVSGIVKDETGIWFTVSNIKSDVKVKVTFKETSKASADDLEADTENVVLRRAEGLFVVKEGIGVTFGSEYPIRMFDSLENELTSTENNGYYINVFGDTTIKRVELYYQADGELYADWHVVDMPELMIVEDETAPEAHLAPSKSDKNGYYNEDVTFNVSVEDKDYYSGIAKLEYCIVYNTIVEGVETEIKSELTPLEFERGAASFKGEITVDGAKYNFDGVSVILYVEDAAGNHTEIKKTININSTVPSVKLEMKDIITSDEQNKNALVGYYETSRELTITIVDRQGTFDVNAVVSGLVVKKNGVAIADSEKNILWTHSEDGETHIGKYVFSDDASYEWSFKYVNAAGTEGKIESELEDTDCSFVIDNSAPSDLEITYETSVIDYILENITFGFYKAPVKVTIKARDDIAAIEKFIYSYTVQEGASETNKGVKDVVVNRADITFDGDTASYTFEIPAQFRGNVSFKVTNRSGKTAELKDDKVVVVDTVAPGIDVKFEGPAASNGKFYNGDRTATITITEANFFNQDLEDGKLLITVGMTKNDGSITEKVIKPEFTKSGDVYTATVEFTEDADYTFSIKYTDRSGNESTYTADSFTVDKTAPVITVSYDNNAVKNGNYFGNDRVAVITVEEHNFDAEKMSVWVNGDAKNVEWTPVNGEANKFTASIYFKVDGHYTLDITGEDLAGNISEKATAPEGTEAPWEFTLDKTAPSSLEISYDSSFVASLIENISFGFYKAPINVTIRATDVTAGVDRFIYSYTVQDGASTDNVGKTDVVVESDKITYDGNVASYTFEIPAQFRGFVSFTVVDKSGNSAEMFDENCVVIDTVAPGIDVEFDNKNAINGKYFNGDRTATITITEANFFEQDLEDGKLLITVGMTKNDGSVSEKVVKPEFTKSGDVYTAKIEFTEDADYTFGIKYTDRSGNESTYTADSFTVDKTAPEISISYDNNNAVNGSYFTDGRAATVTVNEHNFRANDLEVSIVAKNAAGESIDITDYATYLKDQNNWEQNGNVWTASIEFKTEGNYSVELSYADLAGNEHEAKVNDSFCIDGSKPTDLIIECEPTFWQALIDNITFGFYKEKVKVTIKATDGIAGIHSFRYSYVVETGSSSTNTGRVNVDVDSKEITYDGGTASYTFEIPAQFRGSISFTATDKSGNSESASDGRTVVVDNVAPGITVSYDNNNVVNGKYYSSHRTATITITEANFFKQDLTDGLLVITVEKTLNDGKYEKTNVMPEFTKNGDEYTAKIEFAEDADYVFDIKYTDRSGNVYDDYEADVFTVDTIDPEITVVYDNNNSKNENQYNADRNATITVIEHNFRASDVIGTVVATDSEVEAYTNYIKNNDNWTHDGDTHTIVIKFSDEAHYKFGIECVDLAGNDNAVPTASFTLDKSAPDGHAITINGSSVLGTDSIVFDRFYGSTVAVKLNADFDISGVESLMYQKVASAVDYDPNGEWIEYNADTGIVVEPNEKFIIYFRAEDKAGNVSIVNSTGIVVDDKQPIGETKAPEIDIIPVAPNGFGYYDGDVEVSIKAIDPGYIGGNYADNGYYSGLNRIVYRIYTTDTDAYEEGELLVVGEKTDGAETDIDGLIKSWAGKITVSAEIFNSNNVIVEIVAVDNAGNERTTRTVAGDIKIDITKPEIEISYDNNDGDTSFGSDVFFKEDRTVKIVVTERNFDPDLFVLNITNTDGFIPKLSGWQTALGGGNGDGTTHTAYVTFNKDGDYKVSISCDDKAENENVEISVGTSLAPWAFTIDKTAPKFSVSYDNNNALNDNYYKDQRVATITVTEHNFETSRVNIILTATDDGKAVALPNIGSWYSNGNTHTVTVTYSADAYYTFDFEYTDKAGNKAADIDADGFYVDKTAPVLKIEGIVDESANNNEGNIGFVITATDTNFDIFAPVLMATVKKGSSFEIAPLKIGETTDIKNGQVFTVENIEADGIYQILCTLIDKAGNAYTQVILEKADGSAYTEQRSEGDTLLAFSVNRDGSAYEIDYNTVNLTENYYVQSVDNDVVIIETNANELKEFAVTLNGKALAEDVDFTVTAVGGNGSWMKYTYRINRDLFKEEGEYKIVVSSKDEANNDAFSDVKGATVEFVVDRTAPIVTVSGITDGGRYQTESQLVTLIPTDDGGELGSLAVNLVDGNGKVISNLVELSGEALEKALEENEGKITFEVEEGLYQNVQIICKDRSVSASEHTNTTDITVKNVSVSTSAFMIFWANKPLRWGTICGIGAVAIAIVVLVVLKKKKHTAQ